MQPHTANNPCPICGGHRGLPQGRGVRCHGFVSPDGWLHCSREERAGRIPITVDSSTYGHKPAGPCACGETHGAESTTTQIGEARGARVVAEYDYVDEQGALIFQVVRKEPKAFVQRKPDGAGGWTYKLGDVRRVPYRLTEVIAAVPAGDTVHVVEGEKDVEAIRKIGGVATCNAGGAGKWADGFARYFAGAHVVIVADRDERGTDHARQVFASLRNIAASVRVVEAAIGKDAADHIGAGGTLADFRPVYPVDDLRKADPVAWKRAVLMRSLEPSSEPIRMVDKAEALAQDPSPTWPTGLSGEPTHLRHFKGVTFLVGGPSAGKSWLAIGSAICAAWDGWRVLYMASEMSPSQIMRRAIAYTGGSPVPADFDIVEVSYGASVEALVGQVCDQIDERKTLIVLDSISSFVDQAQAAEAVEDVHRIGPLKRMTMWAMNVRRETAGEVSFLVLSERNAAGETKGRFGDHKADLVVSLESHKDPRLSLTKHLAVTKAWEERTGDLGEFLLDPRRARLEKLEDV